METKKEEYIKNGIEIKLLSLDTLPTISLNFTPHGYPSIILGENYFMTYTKINDISKVSTKTIKLFVHEFLKDETDDVVFFKENGIETYKTYGKQHKADCLYLNLSYNKMFYKLDKSDKGAENNKDFHNLYSNDSTLITFKIIQILFTFTNEKYLIIKSPTIVGNSIVEALRLFSYIFGSVVIKKAKEDSWLKDSFLIICSNFNEHRLKEVINKLNLQLSLYKKNMENSKFSIFNFLLIEKEFLANFLKFKSKILQTIHYTHSLLFCSIQSDAKSNDNEYQNKLKNILF